MAGIHRLAGRKTVILISHRLANVTKADNIYVLDRPSGGGRARTRHCWRRAGCTPTCGNRQHALENYRKGGTVMENKRTRGNFNVMCRLVGWYALAPVMVCAVLLGVAGFLCAIFIPVLGVYALLNSLHFSVPVIAQNRLYFAADSGVAAACALRGAGLQPFYCVQAAGPHPGQGLWRAAPAGPRQAGGPRQGRPDRRADRGH